MEVIMQLKDALKVKQFTWDPKVIIFPAQKQHMNFSITRLSLGRKSSIDGLGKSLAKGGEVFDMEVDKGNIVRSIDRHVRTLCTTV